MILTLNYVQQQSHRTQREQGGCRIHRFDQIHYLTLFETGHSWLNTEDTEQADKHVNNCPTGFSDFTTALQRDAGIPASRVLASSINRVSFNQNCAYYDGVGIN